MENKKIIINGKNNKYHIKKATTTTSIELNKERLFICKHDILPILFNYEEQLNLLNKNNLPSIIIQELNRKLIGYKNQDIKKNIYNENTIIQFNDLIQKLIDCNLKCYYCFSEIYLLYKYVREKKQWTLDRINNKQGHNLDNIVLSCLECNLQRRIQSSDNYLFTKQLKLIKTNENSESII